VAFIILRMFVLFFSLYFLSCPLGEGQGKRIYIKRKMNVGDRKCVGKQGSLQQGG
jgi:hypothetical protein